MTRIIALTAGSILALACSTDVAERPRGREEAVSIVRNLTRIVAPEGIQRLETVRIGEIDQYVSIRGRQPDNPVLLVIHGGPGWVIMPVSWWAQQGWDEYFNVVNWDQRGAGKTYALHDPTRVAPTMTRAQMDSDVDDVIRWIRDELGQDRIFVLGHSWGSILGLSLAQRHPEWLHAYVGVGQGIDAYESERRGWRWAMEQAVEAGNDEAIEELKGIAPYAIEGTPLKLDDIYVQRRWVNHFGGAAWRRPNAGFESDAFRLSPEYSDKELARLAEAQTFSIVHLLPAVIETDMADINSLEVPVFLFLGRHDTNLSSRVAAEWFESVKAPRKRLVWFEQSAHEVLVEEPGKVFLTLVNEVRPLAERP